MKVRGEVSIFTESRTPLGFLGYGADVEFLHQIILILMPLMISMEELSMYSGE